jgi:hypothetical protein
MKQYLRRKAQVENSLSSGTLEGGPRRGNGDVYAPLRARDGPLARQAWQSTRFPAGVKNFGGGPGKEMPRGMRGAVACTTVGWAMERRCCKASVFSIFESACKINAIPSDSGQGFQSLVTC